MFLPSKKGAMPTRLRAGAPASRFAGAGLRQTRANDAEMPGRLTTYGSIRASNPGDPSSVRGQSEKGARVDADLLHSEANTADVSGPTQALVSEHEVREIPAEQRLPPQQGDRPAQGQERAEGDGLLPALAPQHQETEGDDPTREHAEQ